MSPADALQHYRLERWAPEPPLDRVVDRIWKTTWSLPEPFDTSVVTYPVPHLVFESDGSATVSGVQRATFQRTLVGDGWALGVMFRPGGLRCLVDHPMAQLTDERLPVEEVLGADASTMTSVVVGADDDLARLDAIQGFLSPRLPPEPTMGETLSHLVEVAATEEPPVTRVSELARRHGVSVRTLQRLFADHVGVPPKLVLDRYRVQAAAERTQRPVASWADVAQDLGYADQAHLTADLSTTYGSPPARYARQAREAEST